MSTSAFLEIFSHRSPTLAAQFARDSDETPTISPVVHRLGAPPTSAGLSILSAFGSSIAELQAFYRQHDGLEFCCTHDSRYGTDRPLLRFLPAEQIQEFTQRYCPGGDRAWTMDFNKTKTIYRDGDAWIAFAEIDSGPACLTTFIAGPNAGCIYYATPEPPFNILRPIAKGFDALLERIARDIPAFLRLVRARVTRRGADGQNYGLAPVAYEPESRDR